MYCFSERQLIILAWFRRNAPSLGELYEGAIRLLCDVRLPGYTRYISHSVREIRNRIPEVLAGVKGEHQLQYKKRIDSIAEKWSTKGLLMRDDGMSLTQDTALPSDDHVRVSETRSLAAKKLFQAASDAKIDIIGLLDPTIRNWLDITDWFMCYVHDRSEVDSTIDLIAETE